MIEYLRPARLALLTTMSSGRMTARIAGVVFLPSRASEFKDWVERSNLKRTERSCTNKSSIPACPDQEVANGYA